MTAQRLALTILLLAARPAPGVLAAEDGPKRWTDDQLVASYRDLVSSSGLDAAVRAPALPKDPPQPGFLEALAWYADGMQREPGTLGLSSLDALISSNVNSYDALLRAKVEGGENNDYPRTRTWKLIQKLTMLREEMSRPPREGRYAYRAHATGAGADAWELEHTIRSSDEFAQKVCRASYERPVLVKYGNTNCTQCMLFEIIGSVKAFAENPTHKDSVAVYKVWFGYQPDAGFAGRIKSPERLDDLAKAEGVRSSPTFVVYRSGRRYTCGDAFPDDSGRDERLESCLRQEFGDAPAASACPAPHPSN